MVARATGVQRAGVVVIVDIHAPAGNAGHARAGVFILREISATAKTVTAIEALPRIVANVRTSFAFADFTGRAFRHVIVFARMAFSPRKSPRCIHRHDPPDRNRRSRPGRSSLRKNPPRTDPPTHRPYRHPQWDWCRFPSRCCRFPQRDSHPAPCR